MLINLINSVIAKKVLNSSVYLKPFAMKTVVCFIISVLFKLKFQGTIKKRFVIAVIRHTLIANLYIIFWRIRYKIISGQCIKLSLVIKLILPSFRKKNITFLFRFLKKSVWCFNWIIHVPYKIIHHKILSIFNKIWEEEFRYTNDKIREIFVRGVLPRHKWKFVITLNSLYSCSL